MNIDVSDLVVIITGSSRGIGRGLAEKFAKENSKVIINYFKSEKQAHMLYNDICKYNGNCICIAANVTNTKEVVALCEKAVSTFGKIDILINNAGICIDSPVTEMTDLAWKQVIDINLTGAFITSKIISRQMIRQGYGKIINIASLKGETGGIHQANYTASKAGMIGLTKVLAKELGVYNIAVNAVCPGFVLTDLNRDNVNKIKNANSQSVLKKDCSMDDLANFIIYMSSNMMNGVSGRVFNMDSRIN